MNEVVRGKQFIDMGEAKLTMPKFEELPEDRHKLAHEEDIVFYDVHDGQQWLVTFCLLHCALQEHYRLQGESLAQINEGILLKNKTEDET